MPTSNTQPMRRRPTVDCYARVVATLLVVVSAGCSAPTPRADSSDAAIWDVAQQRFVDEATLVRALAGARFRLLGEMHDNPVHHAIRARLVTAIAARGARPAVVLEQFDLDHDAALLRAQAVPADVETLVDAGRLDRKAWRWPLHRPILAAAHPHGLPVRAGNLGRAQLREPERLTDAKWQSRLRSATWSETQARAMRSNIVEAHCGKLPESVVPRVVEAQRMRDAAMAQALVDAATADGAILIAGNGHVRHDLGVPAYLPGASAIAVGFVESDARDEESARHLAREYAGAFDYLWLTPRVARDDPCAAMR